MPDSDSVISLPEQELIDKLRMTSRCREEISLTANFFAGLPGSRLEALVQYLIQSGANDLLDILMNVVAVIGVKLPPHILAETLKMIDPIIDFHLPYRHQDASAIEPLLAVVEMEDVSWERQAYGAMIAAELCLKHNGERMKTLKVLRKLSISVHSPEARVLVARGIGLIEKEPPGSSSPSLMIDEDPLERLPKERPPVVIGGTYSVRRPVAKISRNAPCHCGSGKKYKKCCYGQDQEVLRDASPYEGLTMTQVRSQPRLVADAKIIDDLRPFDIKKLAPSSLNEGQLLAAYRKLESYGSREQAFDMLFELKKRPEQETLATNHLEDLLDSAIDAGETGLARRIMAEIPSPKLHESPGVGLRLDIMEKSLSYTELEAMARRGIVKGDEESQWDDPLVAMSYTFENSFPALSIVFARAAMLGNPERDFDNEYLLDVIRSGRAGLDLDPWEDPAETYFEWTLERLEGKEEEGNRSKELEDLNEKIRSAHELAKQRIKELQEKERELTAVTRAVQKAKDAPSGGEARKREEPLVIGEAERETIGRLRRQVDGLKADIRQRQQDHRELRRQLEEERARLAGQASEPSSRPEQAELSGEPGAPLASGRLPRKILVPAYSPSFLKACELMPVPVVVKALRSLANFAAHDETIWRQTKGIERLAGIYRIRIDLSHRLLIRWEENVELKVLDLILRKNLESWIKQYARSSGR